MVWSDMMTICIWIWNNMNMNMNNMNMAYPLYPASKVSSRASQHFSTTLWGLAQLSLPVHASNWCFVCDHVLMVSQSNCSPGSPQLFANEPNCLRKAPHHSTSLDLCPQRNVAFCGVVGFGQDATGCNLKALLYILYCLIQYSAKSKTRIRKIQYKQLNPSDCI